MYVFILILNLAAVQTLLDTTCEHPSYIPNISLDTHPKVDIIYPSIDNDHSQTVYTDLDNTGKSKNKIFEGIKYDIQMQY